MSGEIGYGLVLPDGSDNVDISVLNGNMSIIDSVLADIYSRLPTLQPGINVTYTPETAGVEVIDVGGWNELVVPRIGLVGNNSYNLSIAFADGTTGTITAQAVDISSEIGQPEGTAVIISLGDHGEGVYDGLYFDATTELTLDTEKSGIFLVKDGMATPIIQLSSITIQGPVDTE